MTHKPALRKCVLGSALVVLTACTSQPAPARDDDLPPGGEVIYYRQGDPSVRVVRVGDCYFSEVDDYADGERGWYLNRDGTGFLSSRPAYQCGEEPDLP